ncbi:MAG TPA: tRNA pseudouridine(13) synthase TruD [Gemmataceae bacterium]|nr:tRNA pseudouridine(13) synthase TruD [Gemmataceae bacterium]
MKLKQRPEDFQVKERTDIVPSEQGDFALYRLEKRGWTTPDALGVLRRRWKIDHRRLSYGGLKDRHALTVQHLTVLHGPRRNLDQQGILVTYLGQVSHPYSAQDIRANHFRITLRKLDEGKLGRAEAALAAVREQGVPNYFDDQRFGSLASGGSCVTPEFVARLMVLGRHEDALRLALTAPYEFDRAAQKQEKATLLAHWGDWEQCKENLPRGHARSLVDYLRVHPADFRGALERLRPELRGLYLSAYQSHLWNRTLALYLRQLARPEQLLAVRLRLGEVPFHHNLDAEQFQQLVSATLPLASARLKLDPDDPRGELVRAVLKDEGLELEQMKLKGFREMFFSKGERPALCLPRELSASAEADDLHPGRMKWQLAFELPRGSYATLLVKRLMG